jgi:hypothetical protein
MAHEAFQRSFGTWIIVGVCSLVHMFVQAQSEDNLYFIHNNSSGEYIFSAFDLGTGEVTGLASIGTQFPLVASACTDGPDGRYHLSTGTSIVSFDPNGVLEPDTTDLPLPTGSTLYCLEYDHCEGVFLGMLNVPSNNTAVVRFDPVTGQLGTVLTLNAAFLFPLGGQGMFDPVERLYMTRTNNSLLSVNIETGVLVHNTPIQSLPDLTLLDHLAYDCRLGKIFGTSVGPDTHGGEGKYLCELDPATGEVQVLSEMASENGLLKPLLGGSCINMSTGEFLWSGMDGRVVGADIGTGEMTFLQSIDDGELTLIEHFSWCNCALPTGREELPASPSLLVLPNPAQDRVTITGITEGEVLNIHDLQGRIIRSVRSQSQRMEIDLDQEAPGVYLLHVHGKGAVRFVLLP